MIGFGLALWHLARTTAADQPPSAARTEEQPELTRALAADNYDQIDFYLSPPTDEAGRRQWTDELGASLRHLAPCKTAGILMQLAGKDRTLSQEVFRRFQELAPIDRSLAVNQLVARTAFAADARASARLRHIARDPRFASALLMTFAQPDAQDGEMDVRFLGEDYHITRLTEYSLTDYAVTDTPSTPPPAGGNAATTEAERLSARLISWASVENTDEILELEREYDALVASDLTDPVVPEDDTVSDSDIDPLATLQALQFRRMFSRDALTVIPDGAVLWNAEPMCHTHPLFFIH